MTPLRQHKFTRWSIHDATPRDITTPPKPSWWRWLFGRVWL